MDEKAKKTALLMIPYGLFVLGAKHSNNSTVATVNWVTQASFGPCSRPWTKGCVQ